MKSKLPTAYNEESSEPIKPVTVIEEAVDVNDVKEYGIGIDVHKLFIMVCVRTKLNGVYVATTAKFQTDWKSLLQAKDWCYEILQTKSDVKIDTEQPLHYVIESTATYHYPLRIAWGGIPSVINPTIAGETKRKTDKLDAKRLALHDQTAIWRESYVVPPEVEALRLMIAERERYVSEARSASNRINNALTRFGYNIGRYGSVTQNKEIRSIVENQISDSPDDIAWLCPIKLPMDVRLVMREEYDKYDYLKAKADNWKSRILDKASSMQWAIGGNGKISGEEMIPRLMTAPQIGEVLAITWLAHIVDPNRFHSAKALSAYCALDPTFQISADKKVGAKRRGGCKSLHSMLCNCGARLLKARNEPFGQWGQRIYDDTGKWKKASCAIARKLSVALYYIMMTNRDFTYENYKIASKAESFSMPVEELPLINSGFRRYVHILQEHEILTTAEMIRAYLSNTLDSFRGLGRKFFGLVRDFNDNQKEYREAYKEISSHKTEKYEEENNESQEL